MMEGDKRDEGQKAYTPKKEQDPKVGKELITWARGYYEKGIPIDAVRHSGIEMYQGRFDKDYIISVINDVYTNFATADVHNHRKEFNEKAAQIENVLGELGNKKGEIAKAEGEVRNTQRELRELDEELDLAEAQDKAKKKEKELKEKEYALKGKVDELDKKYKTDAAELGKRYNELRSKAELKEKELNEKVGEAAKIKKQLEAGFGKLQEEWKVANKVKDKLVEKEKYLQELLPKVSNSIKSFYQEAHGDERKITERLITYQEKQLALQEEKLSRTETEHKLKEQEMALRLDQKDIDIMLFKEENDRYTEDVKMLNTIFRDLPWMETSDPHVHIGTLGYAFRKLEGVLHKYESHISTFRERERLALKVIEAYDNELKDTTIMLAKYASQALFDEAPGIQRYIMLQTENGRHEDAISKLLNSIKAEGDLKQRRDEMVSVLRKNQALHVLREAGKNYLKALPSHDETQSGADNVIIEQDK